PGHGQRAPARRMGTTGFAQLELRAASAPPALAEETLERARRLAAGQPRLHVVVGLVRTPVAQSQRIIGEMATVVPPRFADVHATQEGEAAIDHDELLVMSAAGGRMVVEAEMQVRGRHPVEIHALEPFPLAREDHVEVPRDDVDTELGPAAAEVVEE